MELVIQADTKRVDRRLEELERRLAGSPALMHSLAECIIEGQRARWGRGPALSESTVKWKKRRGKSSLKLVETGQMKTELTTTAGIKEISATHLSFGSSKRVRARGGEIPLALAHLHQTGTKHMPKRIVLRVTPKTRRELGELVLHAITKD